MAPDFISRRTRTEFREYLANWTLAEIRDLFANVGIKPDLSFDPPESGQRRRLVEQHYRTIDVSEPADARRLIEAYEQILQLVHGDEAMMPSANRLATQLRRDGFAYRDGTVVSAHPRTQPIFEDAASGRTITGLTRRAIVDDFTWHSWSGRLGEAEFLLRLYDLAALPSTDPRYETMAEDVAAHRDFHNDGPADWVFFDSRLNLLSGSDQAFLEFLGRTVHPEVRDEAQAREMVVQFNEQLSADGWQFVIKGRISGRPIYRAVRVHETVPMPEATHALDILSDQYINELSTKCIDRLNSGDLEGAVTVARTHLEAVLGELELRLTGTKLQYKGDLPRQFKAVAKLLKMDDERPDLDQRFKDVVRGLVTVVGALAPLRNQLSDGHARAKKPALHHVRAIVNASRTVTTFLVESYHFQANRESRKR